MNHPNTSGLTSAVVSQCPICGHPEHWDGFLAADDCSVPDCLCDVCPSCGGHTIDDVRRLSDDETCLRCGGEGISS